MSEPELCKVTYIQVDDVGLVATLQVPSFEALVEYDPTGEVLTIVAPSSICPREDLKPIKEFCEKFGYSYEPPAGGASGSEPPVATEDSDVGCSSGKGKKPVEGELKSGKAAVDDQGRGKQPKVEE